MGFEKKIGKYQLVRTIGEGSFSKVKLAVNGTNGQKVAVKVIDKHMILENNLKTQVKREIRTMKLLHHPNIVSIHEVIGTKTKIYIVMEYVSGGQLLDKLSYGEKLNEREARKLFQQLIDALDYCHNKGVYHRDLKPENLLLDSMGNLKVSDFGLSALQKCNDVLTTRCGSPCYVAPELLLSKGYNGAAADVWSCGVILFELLAGYLPFTDQNLMNLYGKIWKSEYKCPTWFTRSQKKLIAKILEPRPAKRITISDIIEDPWFQKDYKPVFASEFDQNINSEDVDVAFNSIEENVRETTVSKSSSFINAFQLIAMSRDLDLSGLFVEQDEKKQTKRMGSKHTINETIEKIEAAATDARLSVEKISNFKIKMQPKRTMAMTSFRSYLSAQVIEVAPTHCVVEISKSTEDIRTYNKFCESLSNLLKQKPGVPSQSEDSVDQCASDRKKHDAECYEEPKREYVKLFRGYESS
ncbi:CBL-interacting serine/threonine-protein kinase 21 [Vigna radiata var. radiata]|uniref:non-specific serine/threonine protein kinase n=1 Tax=Vigna radiata var. radiata TaxID=3916 RepID=A0A1S3UWT4_VIGRR|nr:CBL-interacting serine/threonine-protein kinase 21 [Vigna radiata var. radiata]XP_022639602.1 CBL-interacting serine/threonine-protein kinase 21 [Vigna radiata var. radiata]XP_022639603.1 CBL-interacting serine/threonine-protein kinase 21 [Vigna radiata var. radiata]